MLGVPLITQSDRGTENFGIANAQTVIRQQLDSNLVGTLQHRWMRGHDNIKSEIMWSQFRRRFAPGFEDILQHGLNEGIYDPADTLQRYVDIILCHCVSSFFLQVASSTGYSFLGCNRS